MDQSVKVRELDKKLTVRFSNKTVILPEEVQERIDNYWQGLIDSGKGYRRGEVFTVVQVVETETTIEVLVEKSDYAHYLYCQNMNTLGEYGIRVIHTACLVITSDRKVVFGKMAPWTARAGMYQLCGGGIDLKDLRGDVFDCDSNIEAELKEELGIDVHNKKHVASFGIRYLKSGGPAAKMTVVYEVILCETEEQFLQNYHHFEQELQKRGEEAEFETLVVLPLKNRKKVEEFFTQNRARCDEYVELLFECVVG